MIQVTGFDHIVLNVADVEVSAAWYRDKLGLELVRMEEWRRGEVLFPSLRIDAATLIDLFPAERTGENLNHFAVVVDADLPAVIDTGEFDLAGPSHPSDLFGAQGQGLGIYVKDPDGNIVELRTYPWRPASRGPRELARGGSTIGAPTVSTLFPGSTPRRWWRWHGSLGEKGGRSTRAPPPAAARVRVMRSIPRAGRPPAGSSPAGWISGPRCPSLGPAWPGPRPAPPAWSSPNTTTSWPDPAGASASPRVPLRSPSQSGD